MIQGKHFNDDDGNPAGGTTYGIGFAIAWQNGPLGRCPDCRTLSQHLCSRQVARNGAFVEEIITAAIDRLRFYQGDHADAVPGSKFACNENGRAIIALREALEALNERTQRRERAGIEGTHAPDAGEVIR